MSQKLFAAAFLISSYPVWARQITVTNSCQYTIWPAMFTGGTEKPSVPTGWEAPAGNTTTFAVPDNWVSGRIWGRTDCDFSKPNVSSCATGACNGGLLCAAVGGTGIPPVTVAEWTLGNATDGSPDNYDVSLVDGFNIPMSVVPTGGCTVASCTANLNTNCPAPLQLQGSGGVVGCKSACAAGLDNDSAGSPNCCTGSHDVPSTCPPSGVQYYSYFKDPCPDSYAYAYDESSKTALWTCPTNVTADYTVTFCPSNSTSSPLNSTSSSPLNSTSTP
ncbi:thaumatin-like protein [Mycena maculata]|uniref:Thaumatin-like protein n=1 Tax=Mycena maculata TaxID=230809 RepID=A0AAD7K3N4_9AGAR|nr:thaumatin-like protein [Mycena maculata]